MSELDEKAYLQQAKQAFLRIERAFDEIEVERADCERSSDDVLVITFASGTRCVINTQRPSRQIWLAAGAEAWHFGWHTEQGAWLDRRRDGAELFSVLRDVVRAHGGFAIAL